MIRRTARGFTLIELMVVLAVIGVLIYLSLTFSTQSDGANGNTVSEQVVQQLQFARQRAISTRRYHTVTITANKLQISEGTNALGTAPVVGMAPPPAYREIQEMTMPSRVIFYGAETTPRAASGNTPTSGMNLPFTLTIKPDGSCDGMTAYITDQSASRQERIIVYAITGSAYARTVW